MSPKTPVPHSFFFRRLRNPDYIPDPRATGPVSGLIKSIDTTVGNALRDGMPFYSFAAPNIPLEPLRELGAFLIKEDTMVVECDKNMGFAVVDTKLVHRAIERKLFSPDFERLDPVDGRKALAMAVTRFRNLLMRDFTTHSNSPKEFYKILDAVMPNEPNNRNLKPNKINPLAKVHKDLFNESTWRLIIQAHNSPFQAFDAWFALLMEPLLHTLPQHIPDSISIIKRLEALRFDPAEPIAFGKVDITDLYNSLELTLVREAIAHYTHVHFEKLGMDRRKTGPWSIDTILALLDIANQNNYVEYQGLWYRQLRGIAMGRAAGVIIAVLTLAYTEIETLTLPEFTSSSTLLMARYIDDIPFVFRHERPLGRVVALRYKQALGIPTTIEADVVSLNGLDQKSVSILDFTVTRVGDHFEISPFDKPTNLHLFIPPRSNHPPHTAKGWILGYLKRLAVNSSKHEAFLKASVLFFEYLRARGFPHAFLLTIFAQVDYANSRAFSFLKHDSLTRTYEQRVAPRTFKPTDSFYFPIPYNRALGSLNWSRLLNALRDLNMGDLQFVTPKYPRFRTAWSSLPNLRTLVVQTLQSRLQGTLNPNPNTSQVAHSSDSH